MFSKHFFVVVHDTGSGGVTTEEKARLIQESGFKIVKIEPIKPE